MAASSSGGQPFILPTANRSIFQPGREADYFVGTAGKPWTSGTFGCVRTEGWQMHEGLDIRCLQRDKAGEPIDPVYAVADGNVAYVNRRPSLSNYGNYVILRHQIDGMEVYTLYAHLREIRTPLNVGQPLKAGEQLAILGRTSNTRQQISKDRAHLHFEIDFVANPRFAEWHKKTQKGERNDHGNWNGQNLLAIDPREVFLQQQALGAKYSLANYVRGQTELLRVILRDPELGWAKRFPGLVAQNPRAQKEGIAAYELALNFNGLPFRLTPRAESELKSKSKIQLLHVNEAEQSRNPCRRLVHKRVRNWELGPRGLELLQLLSYP